MIEQFSGWRRTIGLLMLGCALLAMPAWLRSLQTVDMVKIDQDTLVASTGMLIWDRKQLIAAPGTPLGAHTSRWSYDRLAPTVLVSSSPHAKLNPGDWQFNVYGFGYGEYDERGGKHRFWSAPYWAVVLAPTMLSGWLLRGKPRSNPNS